MGITQKKKTLDSIDAESVLSDSYIHCASEKLVNPYFITCIDTNPPLQIRYDTRLIFKLCSTGLNSEFSFLTGFLSHANKPNMQGEIPIV